jgi:G3E family GTPase
LIKNILNNTIGLKILVIENEIGSEGIDHDLLLQGKGKEDIVLLDNGCVCCTGLLSSHTECFQIYLSYSKTAILIPILF